MSTGLTVTRSEVARRGDAQTALTHSRRLDQVHVAGHRADRHAVVEDQANDAGLDSSVNWRRRRRSSVPTSVWTSYPPPERCPPNRLKSNVEVFGVT